MSIARDYALAQIVQRNLPGWSAESGKGMRTPPAPADPRDRGLAEQIIIGVIKNLLHLRWLTTHYANRPLREIDPLAQQIIAIGLYQLRFLDRIPPSAAVDEAVEQAKRMKLGRASGFVNAVLRNALREKPPRLPDREEEPARYAEVVLSHPTEVFGRLQRLVGAEEAIRICEHNQSEPPTIVRLFEGASPAQLDGPEITITPHEDPGLYVVSPARPGVLADWAERGIAQVQDPTAARVVSHLGLEKGQRVMDRCCGLGTKTLQMAEKVKNSGRVIGIDPSAERMRVLKGLVERRGIENVELHEVGMLSDLPQAPLELDAILIDAPCSNSGVLARRAEARYSQSEPALASLEKLQDRILEDTAPYLRVGGRLMYSTCSIWPEENQQRVSGFLKRHAEYRLIAEQAVLPSSGGGPVHYHDGGYFALLGRMRQ